jgi:pyruvate,water dikinase
MVQMISIPLSEISLNQTHLVGNKAQNLSRLLNHDLLVPNGICITTKAYDIFIENTNLNCLISYELNRKEIQEMRWEELFDTSLRIRNHFLNAEMPLDLDNELKKILKQFEGERVVVRSSGLGEDDLKSSFAGLHESFVNICGIDKIIEAIKLVWTSLWSDAALLYRKELNLDIQHSKMAVIIQKLIIGEKSGILFTQSPNNSQEVMLEAVYGLNQGLVDGIIEPDRWIIDKVSGTIKIYQPPNRRDFYIKSLSQGIRKHNLSESKAKKPPLGLEHVKNLYDEGNIVEDIFQIPQDIEWTYQNDRLFLLQTRPITYHSNESSAYPQKEWYLSLRKSYETLKEIELKIDTEFIIGMKEIVQKLDNINLKTLNDQMLAQEIKTRKQTFSKWNEIYYDYFIPFGHGFRLFGQFYNDVIKPEDAFEFLELLKGQNLFSIQRNETLTQISSIIRNQKDYKDFNPLEVPKIKNKIKEFLSEYKDTPFLADKDVSDLIPLLTEMAKEPNKSIAINQETMLNLERKYFDNLNSENRTFGKKILALARKSYQFRDNDNIYLGKIHGQMIKALNEAKTRLESRNIEVPTLEGITEEIIITLENPHYKPTFTKELDSKIEKTEILKYRQLKGQPASKGLIQGKARVILENSDLFKFKKGEVLICKAIDPNMTFILPLCSGIVEERGGMLVHGALIAREYGIPCVTGVTKAITRIKTGNIVTVDGYLGLVIIE